VPSAATHRGRISKLLAQFGKWKIGKFLALRVPKPGWANAPTLARAPKPGWNRARALVKSGNLETSGAAQLENLRIETGKWHLSAFGK
jgi:hypothetical protein